MKIRSYFFNVWCSTAVYFLYKNETKRKLLEVITLSFYGEGSDCMWSIFQAVLFSLLLCQEFSLFINHCFSLCYIFRTPRKRKTIIFDGAKQGSRFRRDFLGSCCCVHSLTPLFGEAPSRSTDFSFLVPRSRSIHGESFDCFSSSSSVGHRQHSVNFQQFCVFNSSFLIEQKVILLKKKWKDFCVLSDKRINVCLR